MALEEEDPAWDVLRELDGVEGGGFASGQRKSDGVAADALVASAGVALESSTVCLDGAKPLGPTCRRKCVHWTHVRTFGADHVQPQAFSRQQLWEHLARCYAEAYPRPSAPTGSILRFGVVCREKHAQGDAGGRDLHAHCPTFSDEQHYWNKVARISREKYKVHLNAVAHDSYSQMYAYVREPSSKKPLHELDDDPWFSPLHPRGDELKELLASSARSHAGLRGRRQGQQEEVAGAKRRRVADMYDIVISNGLRTANALRVFAHQQAEQGDKGLAEYCARQGHKLQSIVENAWAVADAPQRARDAELSLLEKLARAAETSECSCSGAWLLGAREILVGNNIDVREFTGAMRRAFELGAKRGANVALVGPAGCGKSTLVESLEHIFQCFPKPEKGSTFSLGELPEYDLIMWQDYEHHEDTLRFTDLLSLFVGESVGIRQPGRLNQKFRNKAPCIYSGRTSILSGRKHGESAASLDVMMAERFQTFTFSRPLPRASRRADFPQCGKCCAAFLLDGASGTTDSGAALQGVSGPSASARVDAPPGIGQLAELVHMYREGMLTTEEFAAAKGKLLGL